MMVAAIYGAGSGALHAVSGPDHLLSLGPLALGRPAAPWRIGLVWGLGHAVGTLLLGLPVVFFTQFVHLPGLAAWSDRIAGLALLGTALWSGLSLREKHEHRVDGRGPFWVGLVHGLTGAAALVLMLPLLVQGSPWHVALFLATFAVGSTLAMALLTEVLALLGAQLGARAIRRTQLSLIAGSVVVGASWLLG